MDADIPDNTWPRERDITIEAQLTSGEGQGLADIPREERCITAWVEDSIPPPNPTYALDSLKQCLGEPPVLLEEGSVAFLTSFPCIDDSHTDAHQCESVPGVAVAARLPSRHADYVESNDFYANLRSHGLGRTDQRTGSGFRELTAFVDPESVVIQVKDPEGRVQDSHTHSVSDVSWQTARKAITGKNRAVDGVTITYTRKDIKNASAWNSLGPRTLTVTKADGTTPGKVKIRLNSSGNQFFDLSSGTATKNAFNITSPSTSVTQYFAEFETLGTYLIDYSVTLTDSSSTAYTDSGRYTFHVGPIAELEVRDGGASPRAPADRNALTVLAVNNGPDRSLGARVTGLPKGAEVLHVSQGSYDGTAGEWNIGELEDSDLLEARGFPGHAMLVLAADAGDSHKVAIANSVDYKVCIGSSGDDVSAATESACTATTSNTWHTTPVYDYIDGNNTATISAARGTGGVGEGIPANPRAQTGTTGVMWDLVGLLYGLPVERYEVQWLGGSWTTLDHWVAGNQYVDAAPSGRRDYRVRAVNAAGAKGPWSRSTATAQAGQAGPPQNLRTQADGNNAIDVSWDAPEDSGGSAVTGYTVQWSADGTAEGSWNSAGSATDLTFKHRGLKTGEVRWYRVAARNSSGLGLWSDPVMGQTVSGAPDAPTLTAKALSDYQIELTWNEPKDNGQPITGYRIEWSSDGSANSWNGLADVSADPTSYVDSTLFANERRHYRVRAVNGVGNGGWSRSVSAITQLSPPVAPNLASAEADGPNAIVVTWEEPSFLGDLSVTQYQVQWAQNQYSEIWRGPQTLSGSTLSWRHTGLKPAETWHYQVRASNGGGRWSPWSYILAATTASDNAPKAVSGLSAQYDKDNDQVNLTWNEQTGGDATIQYELEHSEDGSDWRDLATVSTCDAGKCAYADRDIWRGAKLYYRVRASIDGDAGPWSSAQSVTVPPDPPDEPFVMWSEANGSDQIYYEWEPSYYDGGAPVTGYRLLWCRVLDGADDNPCDVTPDEDNPLADPPGYSRIALGASVRSYTQSASPGYVYYYVLRATNGGNRWSEWGYVHSITVYPGLPAAPGLTARAVDANQIKVTWTKPNSYGSEISNYWLYVYEYGDRLHDWDNILDILALPGDRTEWTVGGLSPETTRYFRVRALNDNGEGKYSPLRQATTLAN